MPLHIDEMSSDISIFADDMPLTPQQINKLVQIIMFRLDEKEQDKKQGEATVMMRANANPAMYLGEKR